MSHGEFRYLLNKDLFPFREDIVTVVINGNQGPFEQFPIIMNTMEYFTNILNSAQLNLTINPEILPSLGPSIASILNRSIETGQRTHFYTGSFGFDFGIQP